MPLHTGFNRSKKTKRDTTKRTSTAVAPSPSSLSASRGSVASVEPAKKENGHHQSHTHINGTNKGQKSPSWLQSRATEPKKKAPDVFDFLDDGGSDDDSLENDRDHSQSATKLKPSTAGGSGHHGTNTRAQGWYKWAVNPSQTSSMVSKESTDSRVSPITVDTSPATIQLQLARKNPSQRKPSVTESHNTGDSPVGNSASMNSWDLSMPEAYYPASKTAASMHRSPLPPSPPRSPEDPHRGGRKPKKHPKPSHVSSGYGLLASHLTSSDDTDHAPLYRRFENLNHRVLLHLQDEIAQMEEDLLVLDEYEELHRAASAEHQGTKIAPASRRMDAHAQVYSSLHYRRQELLGALVGKTEQYNNALAAYSKVLQTLPKASERDIRNYRTWMKEKTPVAAAETRFLDHNDDLVALLPRAGSSTTPVYSAIVIASASILMPLLAFSMISEFTGRLIVVTIVGGAAAAIASNYSTGAERLVDSRDGWRCATVYFGFMTIVAMFVP